MGTGCGVAWLQGLKARVMSSEKSAPCLSPRRNCLTRRAMNLLQYLSRAKACEKGCSIKIFRDGNTRGLLKGHDVIEGSELLGIQLEESF